MGMIIRGLVSDGGANDEDGIEAAEEGAEEHHLAKRGGDLGEGLAVTSSPSRSSTEFRTATNLKISIPNPLPLSISIQNPIG